MKAHWNRLRPDVLKRIKPSTSETKRAKLAAARLAAQAKSEARRHKVPIRPVLVGSLAKDTHLRPKPDIDLFLLMPPSLPRERLEHVGVAIGKRILRAPKLRYAEHPYVRGSFGTFAFDVVPAYKVTSGAGKMSAVDRSPFHASYVRKHLRRSQRDEVRVLKQFLKGIGCYGAETATGGFSGYMAELLVLRFGTFWGVLEQLREQAAPIRLALRGKAPPLGGDLVFVDPVDPTRNAAAAVNPERLDTFLRAARAFTAHPTREFFWPRPPKTETKEQLYSHLSHRGVIGMELGALRVREDARLPHLRRFADKIVRRLQDEGFRVVRHAVYPVGRGRWLALWEHEPVALPGEFVHVGPPSTAAEHSRRFLEKWQSNPDALELPHPVDGRWQVRVRRTEREPARILAAEAARLAQGLEMAAGAAGRLRFETGMDLAQRASLRGALTMFLVPREPWEPTS